MQNNKILILVESPNKVKTIEQFLPKNYKVIASVGHISEIKNGGNYWNTGINPDKGFDANFAVTKEKKELVARLTKLVEQSDEVFICSDPDREGEAIAWSLKKFLKIPKDKCKRATFHEISENAVLNALDNPRDIDDNLVHSAHGRAKLDRMFGFRMCNIVQKELGAKSTGRCQGPALMIICYREEEIQNFVPEDYGEIQLNFSIDKENFKAKYFEDKNDDDKDKENKKKLSIEHCKDVIDKCNALLKSGEQFKVTNIVTKKKLKNPSPAFSTITFLEEASSRLGMGSDLATSCAQKLFEGLEVNHQHVGLITYIRTDSTEISEEFLPKLASYVKNTYGKEYYAPARKGKKNELAQDGHEALRVVDLTMTPEKLSEYISDKNLLRVYNIIYQRTVASSMAPSITRETVYTISLKNYTFKLTSKELEFDGYKKCYKFDKEDDELVRHIFKENENISNYKPTLKLEEKKTQPPSRYKEATFLKELEASGIGRPSTYRTIIKTILDESRGYCTLVDKCIVPTQKGINLCKFLSDHYSELVNVDFTKDMEKDLDLIAEGKLKEADFLKSFYDKMESTIAKNNKALEQQEVKCPICGKPMVLRTGKYGKFYGCVDYPKCKGIKKAH